MKKNGMIKKIIILCLFIYVFYIFISQEKSLSEYKQEQQYISKQVEEQKEQKEILENMKKNANSKEYIEQIAREKLNMYSQNERVYIDIQK